MQSVQASAAKLLADMDAFNKDVLGRIKKAEIRLESLSADVSLLFHTPPSRRHSHIPRQSRVISVSSSSHFLEKKPFALNLDLPGEAFGEHSPPIPAHHRSSPLLPPLTTTGVAAAAAAPPPSSSSSQGLVEGGGGGNVGQTAMRRMETLSGNNNSSNNNSNNGGNNITNFININNNNNNNNNRNNGSVTALGPVAENSDDSGFSDLFLPHLSPSPTSQMAGNVEMFFGQSSSSSSPNEINNNKNNKEEEDKLSPLMSLSSVSRVSPLRVGGGGGAAAAGGGDGGISKIKSIPPADNNNNNNNDEFSFLEASSFSLPSKQNPSSSSSSSAKPSSSSSAGGGGGGGVPEKTAGMKSRGKFGLALEIGGGGGAGSGGGGAAGGAGGAGSGQNPSSATQSAGRIGLSLSLDDKNGPDTLQSVTKLDTTGKRSELWENDEEMLISSPNVQRKRTVDEKSKMRAEMGGLTVELHHETENDEDLLSSAHPEVFPLDNIADHEIDYRTIRRAMRAGNTIIGQGAFGTVRKGLLWGTEVAIKLLRPTENSHGMWMNEAHHNQAMQSVLADFQREVSIMSRLRHANVVLFMGACTTWPHLAIVTEYVRCYLTPPSGGGYKLVHSLADCLEWMQPTWEFKSLTRIARDIAKGMNWLHAHDIVHGDLSVNNLLLAEDATVKIVDFGLSKVRTLLQGEESHIVDKARDVYDYGVILWQLLTRRRLTNIDPGAQNERACPRESRVCIRETPAIPDNCPAWMHALISSCWNPDRRARPTFAQILDSLKGRDGLLKWRQRTTIFTLRDENMESDI